MARGPIRMLPLALLALAAAARGAAIDAPPRPAPAPFRETEARDLRPRLAAVEGRGLLLAAGTLHRFQPESETWTVFGVESGLPAPPLSGFSATSGDLWICGTGASYTGARFDDWQLYRPQDAPLGASVRDIESNEDYAYAATDEGAARFDRYVLEWEALPAPLGGEWGAIEDVAVDGERVWFALGRGVAEYRQRTERVRVDSLLGQLASPRVLALRQTSRHIWAITAEGVARFDKDLETWTSFAPGVELPDARIRQATLIGEDLWLAGDGGLWRYIAASGIWRRDEAAAEMPGERVFAFAREQGLWVLTERAFAWYDETAARWIDFTLAVPMAPEAAREIGWVGGALLIRGRDAVAHAVRGSESNPALLTFHVHELPEGEPPGAEGPAAPGAEEPELEAPRAGWRLALDRDGLGCRRSADEALTLKGGATVYVEDDDASKAPGESDLENLISATRYDLTLSGRLGKDRSLSGLYDTTDPDNEAYQLGYRGRRDDRLRAASAGEIDPQIYNAELTPLAGLRGGWLRLESGGRSAEVRRRRITADAWGGERRTYPGRELFSGPRSVYRLPHRNLVPESEQIRLDREVLRAAIDYTIDWEHGSFTLAEHLLLDEDAAVEATYLYEIASGDSPAAGDSALSDDRLVLGGEVGLAPSDRVFLGVTGASWSPGEEARAEVVGLNARYEEKGERGFLRVSPEIAASRADSSGLAGALGFSARRDGLEVTGRLRRMGSDFVSLEDRRTRLGRLAREAQVSARWDLAERWQAIVDWDEVRSDIAAGDSARAGSGNEDPIRTRVPGTPIAGRGREELLAGTLRFLGGGWPNISLRQARVRIDSLGVRHEKQTRRGEIELAPAASQLAGTGIQRLWLRAFFQRSLRETPGEPDALGNTQRTTDQTFVRLNGSAGAPLAWNLAWDERWTHRPQGRGAHGLARDQAIDVTLQTRPHAALDAYARGEARRELRWRESGGAGGFELARQVVGSAQIYPGCAVPLLRALTLRCDLEGSSGESGLEGEPLPAGSGLWRSVAGASLRRSGHTASLETRLQILSWLRLVERLRRERGDEESRRLSATEAGHESSQRSRLLESRLEVRPRGGLITLRAVTERRRAISMTDTTLAGGGTDLRAEADTRSLRCAGEWNQTWGGGWLTYGALELRRSRDHRPEPLREWTPQARLTYRRARGELDASLGFAWRCREIFVPGPGGGETRSDRRSLDSLLSLSVRPLRLLTLKLQHQAIFERGLDTEQSIDLRLIVRA